MYLAQVWKIFTAKHKEMYKMKTTSIIMAVLTTLLMIFTIICGLWINSQGSQITDLASSVNFHKIMAIGTAIFMVITLVLVSIRK